MQRPEGVLLAPTFRKNESVVLRERHCDDAVPGWGADGACRA